MTESMLIMRRITNILTDTGSALADLHTFKSVLEPP
jgi:hypothetical protein